MLRPSPSQQGTANPQMYGGAGVLRNERVRGLLNPIVQELPTGVGSQHESGFVRRQKGAFDRLVRLVRNPRELGAVRLVAQTRKDREQLLGSCRKAPELTGHQEQDAVRRVLSVDLLEIPHPTCRANIVEDETQVSEGLQELNQKERIPAGFVVHHHGQGPNDDALGVERVGHQCFDVGAGERREHDLMDPRTDVTDRAHALDQWVGRWHFVVSIRTDQEQAAHIGRRHQVLDEVQARNVEPLQVV